ncbi:NifU family protein [Rhizobium sp. BK251]|uniref:NifU family protein n=1 Tax=Rhizobium sp. BK251 TaxID=2512125 RepID=UPI00104DA234|nr:NifU family protein [Rhizobium sp. BK251]TCL72207.1 Fe-S cluster biogenesis protein NfuA [Rhizobium sp. BK251]
MFIQTEATPNPATLKFLPGRVVMESGTADFRDAADAETISPLAARLFEISGVTGVYFGYDFITVSKENQEWQHLKPAILGSIMEHFMSGKPVMSGPSMTDELDSDVEFFDAGDESIVLTIKELLETRVRPAVAQDGGDITFRGFRDGKVYLNMKGSCSGCPSSTATLKHGVQNLLRHFVPEVQEVEAV